MESNSADSSCLLQFQRELDACCQEFEAAWKDGKLPKIEEYIARVPQQARAVLIRELLLLELHYRRDDQGKQLSEFQVCALHPDLMPEIAEQAEQVRRRKLESRDGHTTTHRPSPQNTELEPTIDHVSNSRGSRGLHIRCPHCSNAVELLTDTPFESITCKTCGSAFSLVDHGEETRQAPILKKIGRFELVSRVGMGGFGTVWKARDTELDRTVAVKIPRRGQLAREEVEQFFREARSAAQLRHPNIVPVHEVGRDGDTVFIVSDLIRGVSLSDWLSGATPNTYEIAQLMATISDALEHAHQQGVIHRDLKPSNILLDDLGQPHIMDFGLAKREVGEITMTVDGNVLGTPAYMSPEQAAGEGHWTDRRTDIYSLGVILFKMMTGELPFRGNAQMQIHQRLTVDPPDPRTLNRHLPRDLCTICLRCLERDPNRRFHSAKELAEEFKRYLRHEPILARPISRVERTLRWSKRNPALTAALALTVLLAIAGPAAAVVFHRLNKDLQSRIVENDNLIRHGKQDVERLNAQAKDLRSQLDVWEGKANPWTFWPPRRGASPRQDLATRLLEHANVTLTPSLHERKFRPEIAVCGNLGLAILSDAVGKSTDAEKYYRVARDQLAALGQPNGQQSSQMRTLAACDVQLARLNHDTVPEAAATHLQSARTIYRQLANEHSSDINLQIDWLETELASAIAVSPASRAEYLERVDEVRRLLERRWPTDPEGLYKLACYLTEQEAFYQPTENNRAKDDSGS